MANHGSSFQKILMGAAGSVGEGLDVDNVFRTFTYIGNGSGSHRIYNNIDLANEGGLLWIKRRDDSAGNFLLDTERGKDSRIRSDSTNVETTGISSNFDDFNSDGFTLESNSILNGNGYKFVSWTWRKAPKFFDVVKYTGNGSNRTIAHSLGSTPGMIFVKQYSPNSYDWRVWHRTTGNNNYHTLNSNVAVTSDSSYTRWSSTAHNSTTFSVGTAADTNANGESFIAYLFAHNNSDGGYGSKADQDIIKCDNYTGNGSSSSSTQDIDLGFEPQFLMIKRTDSTRNWIVYDNIRGMANRYQSGEPGSPFIRWDTSSAEADISVPIKLLHNGFRVTGSNSFMNANSGNYIYMAIRRGSMKAPTLATNVFDIDTFVGTSPHPPSFASGLVNDLSGGTADFFPRVDMLLERNIFGNYDWKLYDRLRGPEVYSKSNGNTAEVDAGADDAKDQDVMSGIGSVSSSFDYDSNHFAWMWARAPSYFDIVTYTGNSSDRTISHNLGAAPEMIWTFVRNADGYDRMVYHKGVNDGTNPEQYWLKLNGSNSQQSSNDPWNQTAPTDSVFSVGTDLNTNRGDGTLTAEMIAYLFASTPGVSHLGNYTGNGSTQNIDCGFSSGSKLVIIKSTSSSYDWFIFDTERGISSGNDSEMTLNNNDAQVTSTDYIDSLSSGFTINNLNAVNKNGEKYIYYAIAA